MYPRKSWLKCCCEAAHVHTSANEPRESGKAAEVVVAEVTPDQDATGAAPVVHEACVSKGLGDVVCACVHDKADDAVEVEMAGAACVSDDADELNGASVGGQASDAICACVQDKAEVAGAACDDTDELNGASVGGESGGASRACAQDKVDEEVVGAACVSDEADESNGAYVNGKVSGAIDADVVCEPCVLSEANNAIDADDVCEACVDAALEDGLARKARSAPSALSERL